MFDGLKEKLGRFSEDVEEDIDEEAVEAAEHDTAKSSDEVEETERADAPEEAEKSEAVGTAGDEEIETASSDDAGSGPADDAAEDADTPEEVETASGGADSGPVAEGVEATTGVDTDTAPGASTTGLDDTGTDSSSVDDAADDAPSDDDGEADAGGEDDEGEESSGGLLSRFTGGSGDEESGNQTVDVSDAAESDLDAADATESVPAEPESDAVDAPEDESGSESQPEQPPETADEGDGDAGADGEGDRGLAEKAKLFATGKTVIAEDDLQGHLDDLEIALLQSDVEMGVAQEILEGVEANLTGETRRRLESTGNLVQDALQEALYDVISVGQFDFEQRIAGADKPVVIIFTGVNGVGKTTTIAKLSRYLEDRGYSSVLANGDTYRAGANEQLQQHADNLDRKVISHEQGSDPAAVIYDGVEYAEANDVDVVLGDTAGRLHNNEGLMDQLEKIDRVIDPDMVLFVDEAVAGQDAVNRAREFDNAAEVDGAVLTKADADPQGGAAISIAHVTGKPILFLGTGQEYDDLTRFDPEEIVDRLLGE